MMNRRDFLWGLGGAGLVIIAAPLIGQDATAEADSDGTQTFAFYQGLGPDEARDPSRTDGTNYKMPFITGEQIRAGAELQFDFWHGHGGKVHHFKVTSDHLSRLAAGADLEIYTDVIDGHRHAIRLPKWIATPGDQ